MAAYHDDAFLQAICADPDDDTPRLVYADWLEENGRPERAEFIRVQIELARGVKKDSRRKLLLRRQKELLEEHEAEWRASLPRLRGVAWGPYNRGWKRGFIATASVATPKSFRDHVGRLFASAPIQEIEFGPRFTDRSTAELFYLPEIAHLRRLFIVGRFLGPPGPLGPQGARALADSPYLARLHELNLLRCGIGGAGAAALAASPHLKNLLTLRLEENELDADALRILADSPILARVTFLDLARNPFGDRGARALAESRHLSRLRMLWLGETSLSAAGCRALAESPFLPRLAELSLVCNRIGNDGIGAFAASAHRRWLATLHLAGTGVRTAAAKRLLASPALPCLALITGPWPDMTRSSSRKHPP